MQWLIYIVRTPNLIATLYYTDHGHIAQTQIPISDRTGIRVPTRVRLTHESVNEENDNNNEAAENRNWVTIHKDYQFPSVDLFLLIFTAI